MKQAKRNQNLAVLAALLVASALCSGCLGFGKKKKTPADSSVAPDKVLYERSMDDIKHGRYTIGRLSLQTLINTYPDSEYLAKAKLAIGDSYYKEGGTSGLTQAIAEYKDFITFFPFLEEAPFAQMRVAMAHYRMMEKPDRDRTQALNAEDEFQTFLLKYPTSDLAKEASQRLREVQEVLAEGDFRVARFYYIRQSYRASAARLLILADRYPLYSQADKVDYMLGDIYQRAEKSDWAAKYYARIVRDYPMSNLAADAKKKLTALGYPTPQPDPNALARMQQEQQTPRPKNSLMRRGMGMFRSGPDVRMASHTGDPNLNPPSENAGSVLTPGGLSVGGAGTNGGGGGTSGGSVAVETVPAGSTGSTPSDTRTPRASGTPPEGNAVAPTDGSGSAPAADANSSPDASAVNPTSTPTGAPQAAPNSSDSSKGPNPADGKKGKDKESSSKKKKKGLRKVIPW